jgi:signal transduction histidine kinase
MNLVAKFNIRARTIDLLGRQQIASISTAISELFKNAHDAYATRAEVDYFRDDGLFVLRDDGLGMSRNDFESRWLTLGTDSKVGAFAGIDQPAIDPNQDVRPLLGEKGIGRLAIAVIGRQVLVLTRAKIGGVAAGDLTAAYIHWGLFELPGIDLHEIEIPVETFSASALPDRIQVSQMVDKARACVASLSGRIAKETEQQLLADMDSFEVDPKDASSYLGEPSFQGVGTGTHFYIQPADRIIEDDIDTRESEDKPTRIEKNLIGFTNTMSPNFKEPKIKTSFRDYVDEGEPQERVGEKSFFSPEEFKKVDHHIQGRFDKFGQFRGKVGIYQTEPTDYVLNWLNANAVETACGPFDFSIAIIQAETKDSLVEPIEHATLHKKLWRHGGIYIYKDGIRVQPYGGPELDFLDIERRRTKRAATSYYSFRNIMGAVELTAKDNPKLVEKAGREGFREDRAYREFRSILINFFMQTASDFFVADGRYAEDWTEKRAELQRLDEVRKRREKQSKAKKGKFSIQLETFFAATDKQEPQAFAAQLKAGFESEVASILTSNKPEAIKAQTLGRLEAEAKQSFESFRKSINISKPRGVGLNSELRNNWQAYLAKFDDINKNILVPIEREVEKLVTNTVKNNSLNLNPSLRLNAAVQKHADETMNSIKSLRVQADAALTEVTKTVRETTKNSFRTVSKVVDDVRAELSSIKGEDDISFDLSERRQVFEATIATAFDEESEKLRKITDQLDAIIFATQTDGLNLIEVTEALEEEAVSLRERQVIDFELAQIGMALNTINHEFGKTAGGLRDGLRRLSSWANANPEIEQLYNDMRVSFDHLDNYLALFNPLDRRLQAKPVDIKGSDIYRFVSDLFQRRFERHSVTLIADNNFKKYVLHGYRADFYPVFVNLIDNSIYWSTVNQKGAALIELIEDNGDLCIRDNGRGVSTIDVLNVFELNFTRKPGGRGMGLHISKQALSRLGYELTLDPPKHGEGACFRISKRHNIGEATA